MQGYPPGSNPSTPPPTDSRSAGSFGTPAQPRIGVPYGAPVQPQSGAPYGAPVQPQSGVPYGAPVQPQSGAPYGTLVQPQSGAPYGAPVQPQSGVPYGAPVQPQPGTPYGAPVQPQPGTPYGVPVQPQPGAPYGAPVQPQPGTPYGAPMQPSVGVPEGAQTPPQGDAPEQVKPFVPARQRTRAMIPYLILVAVLILAGVYLYFQFRPDPPGLATIEFFGMRAEYGGDALIVRDETVFINESRMGIEYAALEGEMVSRGDLVCQIYTSTSSTRDLKSLRTYRMQIRDYLIGLTPSLSDLVLDSYNRDVLMNALECRLLLQSGMGDAIARQNALQTAIDMRQSYLRQKYPDDQKLMRLYDEENTRRQSIETYTKQYSAVSTGLVSFYCDGYETPLNMNTIDTISPGTARRVVNGDRVEGFATNGFVYRQVTQGSWGVLLLCDNITWMPSQGATYNLVIESMQSMVVSARLLSFTLSGGELLLRLQVTSDVSDMLYTRSCRASVGETVQSYRVPVRAIVKDDALGTCVMCVLDQSQGLVPVRVLSRDEQYAYVLPGTGYEMYIVDGQTVRTF